MRRDLEQTYFRKSPPRIRSITQYHQARQCRRHTANALSENTTARNACDLEQRPLNKHRKLRPRSPAIIIHSVGSEPTDENLDKRSREFAAGMFAREIRRFESREYAAGKLFYKNRIYQISILAPIDAGIASTLYQN